jgi:leucyl aminopeptidase
LLKYVTTKTAGAVPLAAIAKDELGGWLKRNAALRPWVEATGFSGRAGEICLIPGTKGRLGQVLVGLGDFEAAKSPWPWGNLSSTLPKGTYRITPEPDRALADSATLGWALGSYRFGRYRKVAQPRASLVWPRRADRDHVTAAAEATFLARDLINTPASDMGPPDLARAARDLARRYGARFRLISGNDLLKRNYPAVHAVGRASSRPPCLIDFTWGRPADPKVTLVGKGVCFDSGGLDLKSSSNMKLMKKDMGGAANVLGLASMIMALKLKVRLRVLVPAVENSVSGNAMRPLDVLSTRKGLTIEIGNTDAEGRVILSDALAEASTEKPVLLVDFATLTGAARVALGTELPALFCNDDDLAAETARLSVKAGDPLWRLPLWKPYRDQIDSKVADITNAPAGAFGGAITAALFLQEFVGPNIPWVHIDLMAWNTSSKPGRPEGGEAMGMRALFEVVKSKAARR